MSRRDDEAALLGHPAREEDDLALIELRRQYSSWVIGRAARGFEAMHRSEPPNPRRERAGIKTELRTDTVRELSDALFVQRALRGDGAEAIR